MKAVLGLGTNIGDRIANLNEAVSVIDLLPNTNVIKVSSVYETKPWGFTQQDDFLNICIIIETDFSPHVLLGMCLGIEASMGRVRNFKNGPRIIDIDLLLYEDFISENDELTVPHKFIKERSFVLVPLNDICENKCFYTYNFEEAFNLCDKNEINMTNYQIQYK